MPCKPVLSAAILLSLGLAASLSAVAQLERQHSAHVHGVATGNLAQDGQSFRLELEIPGINLVGFEHAPRTEAQQESLKAVLALLNQGEWLSIDGRGRCDVERINAHTHGFAADEEGDYGDKPADHADHDHADPAHGHEGDHGHHHDSHRHGHDHDHGREHEHGHSHSHAHEHEHDHDDAAHDHAHGEHDRHHDHDHAEFHIVAHIQCQQPEALRWMDLNLFADFPGNERMSIDVLTDTTIGRAELVPGGARIDLSGR